MFSKLIENDKYHPFLFACLLIFCTLLLVGRTYKTRSAIGGDAVYYFANLRSLVIDQDLNLQDEYEYFHHQVSPFTGNTKIPVIPQKNIQTGKLTPKYPIGTAIALSPLYLITHLILLFLQNSGIRVTTDGYSLIYQLSAALSSLLYGWVGILLTYQLGKQFFHAKIALISSFLICLATPLIYYMTMEPLSSQSISFFFVSLFIYLWFISRKQTQIHIWVLLGVIGGLMSITRYQDSLFLLLPILDFLINFQKKTVIRLLLFLIFTGIVVSIQLTVNNYFNGSFLNTGVYSVGLPYLTSPKIFYTLLSLQRGLFVWSPVLIFSVFGLYWFAKKIKFIGSLLLLISLLQIYITSSWADPTQGDSFGNRILINLNIIFALGIMQFLNETKSYHKIFSGIFSLLILLNGILAGLFIFRIIGQPY